MKCSMYYTIMETVGENVIAKKKPLVSTKGYNPKKPNKLLMN